MCDTACHTGGHRNGLVWEILFNISQLVAVEPRAVACFSLAPMTAGFITCAGVETVTIVMSRSAGF